MRPAISIRSSLRRKPGAPDAAVALIDAAKRISPTRLDLLVNQDNARAIRFYEKHGFAVAGIDSNPRSGAPLYRMSWRPKA